MLVVAIITAAAVLGLVAPLLLTRSLRAWALGLLGLAAAAGAAIGVNVSGVPPADVLFVLAAILAVASGARPRLPGWMTVGVGLLLLPAVFVAVWPPDPSNLPQLGLSLTGVRSNSLNILRFSVGLLLVPAIIVGLRPSVNEAWRIAELWALGATVSAAVAITDRLGVTQVQASLLGLFASAGRETGLTNQPNQLALTCVLALPIVIVGYRRHRAATVAATAILLTALYLTGSRGGIAALFASVVLAVVYNGRWIVRQMYVVFPAGLLTAAAALAFGGPLLSGTRFVGGAAATSDVERAALQHLSVAAFRDRPFTGHGFVYIETAHFVPLQLLASGGVLALVGFYLYTFTATWRAGTFGRVAAPALGAGVTVTLGTWLAFGLAENQIINRFLYVPVGLALALAALAPREVRRGHEIGRGGSERATSCVDKAGRGHFK